MGKPEFDFGYPGVMASLPTFHPNYHTITNASVEDIPANNYFCFAGANHNLLPINKKLHSRLLFLILSCAGSFAGLAQVRFYTLLSEQEVLKGQPFQVQYVVEGTKNIKQFELPFFRGFEQLDVFESAASSISAQSLQLTETYSKIVVLLCKKTGRFTIPGASAVIDGKKMYSGPVKLTIANNGFSSATIRDDTEPGIPLEEISALAPGENPDEKVRKNLMLKVSVSKTTCFVGEPLEVSYKLYSRLNASSQILKRPSLTGFSVVEMVDAYNSKPDLEKLNGQWYYVNLIRKVQVFPLQAGTILLDAAEIASDIHFMRTGFGGTASATDMQSLLGRPVSGTPYIHHVTIKSEPLPIVVRSLPEEQQPEDFSGAIGRFSLHLEVMQKKIQPGDLVKVNLHLKGTGNLQLLTAPVIHWPREIDTAEPAVSEAFNKYVFPLSGFKTFTYSFIAPDSGQYHIPAATMIYFDPATKQYKSASSNSMDVAIEPGSGKKGKVDIVDQARDDGYLPGIPRQLYWFGLVVLLIAAWIIYQFVEMRKPAKPPGSDIAIHPSLQVEAEPPLLEKAQSALASGNTIVFYEELQAALWKMAGSKFGLPSSAMNTQNLQQAMRNRGETFENIQTLTEILNECSWALYVPGYQPIDKYALMNKAEELMLGLNNKIALIG